MAPRAIDCTVAGSDKRRRESGALGLPTSSVSHAASSNAAEAPSTRTVRVVGLICSGSSEGRLAGSETDLRKPGEGPEVAIREAVKPERVRIARQAGHFGIVSGVLGKGEQVAPDHPDPEVVDAETELRQRTAIKAITQVQLLDLHVRARLDKEVDRVDAVIEEVVIVDRLLPGAVRRASRGGWLVRLVVDPVAPLPERPLPGAALHAAPPHPLP